MQYVCIDQNLLTVNIIKEFFPNFKNIQVGNKNIF